MRSWRSQGDAPKGTAASSAKRARQGEDQEPDQPADQRSIDADILQVLADLQLKAIDERRSVPVVNHCGDIVADLGPARQDRAQRQESEPPASLPRMLACL